MGKFKTPEAHRLPSKNWRIRILDPVTKKYRSFTSDDQSAKGKRKLEREALAWLDQREIEAERGKMLTFEKAARVYIEMRRPVLSPTTISNYEKILRNNCGRFEGIPVDEITTILVQDWVNELTMSKAAKSVHNMYGFFTAVMGYHDVPIRLGKIKLPPKTRTFKRLPEAHIVADAFKGHSIELPVMLALWQGMRLSEILGMRKCDIDENGVLTINQVRVKVGKEWIFKNHAKTYNSNRQVRLAEPILRMIDEVDVPEDQPVIGLNGSQIYSRFVKRIKEEGYTISFHDLRHINASVMAALGIPDIYAMARGGWSNTTTLKQVYQQTFDNERIKYDTLMDKYFLDVYDLPSATSADTNNSIPRKKAL